MSNLIAKTMSNEIMFSSLFLSIYLDDECDTLDLCHNFYNEWTTT